jgi:hypothetical protein
MKGRRKGSKETKFWKKREYSWWIRTGSLSVAKTEILHNQL